MNGLTPKVLILLNEFTPRVLIQFDKSINNALATRVKTKLHFKVGIPPYGCSFNILPSLDSKYLIQAEKLNTYRFCDNVWTFMLKEVLSEPFHLISKHDFLCQAFDLNKPCLNCRLSFVRTVSLLKLTE